jgi:hypothetical protein
MPLYTPPQNPDNLGSAFVTPEGGASTRTSLLERLLRASSNALIAAGSQDPAATALELLKIRRAEQERERVRKVARFEELDNQRQEVLGKEREFEQKKALETLKQTGRAGVEKSKATDAMERLQVGVQSREKIAAANNVSADQRAALNGGIRKAIAEMNNETKEKLFTAKSAAEKEEAIAKYSVTLSLATGDAVMGPRVAEKLVNGEKLTPEEDKFFEDTVSSSAEKTAANLAGAKAGADLWTKISTSYVTNTLNEDLKIPVPGQFDAEGNQLFRTLNMSEKELRLNEGLNALAKYFTGGNKNIVIPPEPETRIGKVPFTDKKAQQYATMVSGAIARKSEDDKDMLIRKIRLDPDLPSDQRKLLIELLTR